MQEHEYKARDKTVQKMSRDGLREKISAVKRKSGLPDVRQMRRKQPDTGNRSWTLERSEKLILQKKQLRE